MFDKESFNIQKAFKLATQNHVNKKFEEAKKLYNEILKIKPDHANALNNLGELFRALNEFCTSIGAGYEVLAISLSTKRVAVKLKKN